MASFFGQRTPRLFRDVTRKVSLLCAIQTQHISRTRLYCAVQRSPVIAQICYRGARGPSWPKGPILRDFTRRPSRVQQCRILSDSSKPSNSKSGTDPPKKPYVAAEPTPTQPVTRNPEPVQDQTRSVRDKVKLSLPGITSHENIYNLPNILTVSRLIAAPVTAYLLVHDHFKWALALFAYAGITDLVDGWIARKWKLQTVAGSVMDPMADKALMIILTVTLAVKGAIPLYLATLILGRDATLAIAAIYYRYASLPAPRTMMRYWDFSLPSAEVHPTTVSKYNTFLQLILIGSTLALPVITAGGSYEGVMETVGLADDQLHELMKYFQWLVAGTTAWSGLSYAYLKNAVTIIGSNEALKAKQGARGRGIIGVTFGSVVAVALYLAFTTEEEREALKDEDNVQASVNYDAGGG